MTWDQLVTSYTEYLKTTGRAAKTVDDSQRRVREFRDFCRPFGAMLPADVTAEHVAAFEQRLRWMPGKHGALYSPHSVQHVLLMVRLCFRWAVRQGHLLMDPFRGMVICKVQHTPRRLLSVEQ